MQSTTSGTRSTPVEDPMRPSWDDLESRRSDVDGGGAELSIAADADADEDADDELELDGTERPPRDDPRARATLSAERIAWLQGALRRREAAGVLLSDRRNFSWLTVGGTAHVLLSSPEAVASVLVTPDRALVVTSNIEADRIATEEIAGLGLPIETYDWFADGGARGAAEARIRGTLLTDADLADEIVPVRSVLAPLEHARMAWLGDRVRDALDQALEGVEVDEPEDFLAADATMILGDAGVRAPVVLVAADERIDRFRHPLPTRQCIQRRVMLVLVGERWGVHVAATAFRELEPPTADLLKRSRAVDRVLAAMVDATRPGATFGSVFAATQRAYRTAGFPEEWRLHHQGGSIGYSSRERIAVPDDPTPIRAGMAFAWNPSITGTKVETTFVLGPDGEVRALV
jgi:Xaa-Pro dipeptidase